MKDFYFMVMTAYWAVPFSCSLLVNFSIRTELINDHGHYRELGEADRWLDGWTDLSVTSSYHSLMCVNTGTKSSIKMNHHKQQQNEDVRL